MLRTLLTMLAVASGAVLVSPAAATSPLSALAMPAAPAAVPAPVVGGGATWALSQRLPNHVPPALLLLVCVGAACFWRRRRLPEGLGAGMLVVSVTTAVLILSASAPASARPPFASALTPLAVLWAVCGMIGGWQPLRSADGQPVPASAVVFRAAGLCCGVGAAAVWLSSAALGTTDVRFDATIDLLSLASVAALGAGWFSERGDRLALAGASGCLLHLWHPLPAATAWQEHAVRWQPALGGLALFLVLSVFVWEWRQRRRWWLTQPRRLAEPRPRRAALHLVAAVSAAACGLLAWLADPSWWIAISLWVAGLAAFGVYHRLSRGWEGELGLLLTCQGTIFASVAWCGQWSAGVLVGLLLATLHTAWLSAFWRQQLDASRAWTSSGALSAVALRAATALILVVGGLTLVSSLPAGVSVGAGGPTGAGAFVMTRVALLLLAALLLARCARQMRSHGAELGAIVATVSLAALAQPLLPALVSLPVSLVALLAGLTTLLALRLSTPLGVARPGPIALAFVVALMPVLLLATLLLLGPDAQLLVALVLSLGAAVVTLNGVYAAKVQPAALERRAA